MISINTKLKEQFELELDYYVIKAAHTIVTHLREGFSYYDEQKYGSTINKLASVSKVLHLQLASFEKDWNFVLGSQLLTERLLAKSYPIQTVNFIVKKREHFIEDTFYRYSELQTGYDEDILINSKYKIFNCMQVLVTLSNLTISFKIGYKTRQIYKTIKALLTNIHMIIIPYIHCRLSKYIEQLYPEVINLFAYKTIFLYVQFLIPRENINKIEDKALVDAYLSFKEKVFTRLEKVVSSDLWFLGNHEFEKCFSKLGIKGDLQKSTAQLKLAQVKQQRMTLRKVLSQLPNQKWINVAILSLLNDETFYKQLCSMEPEFKQLYHQINQCIVDLICLYENFELDQFFSIKVLDSKDSTLALLEHLHFQYDTLEEGDLLQTERCETLKSEVTTDPTKDHWIKTIHEKGIKYRNEYIRKNLVTVYLFDTEA